MYLNHDEVVKLARRSLEIDERPEETLPIFYLDEFRKFTSSNPNDTNFIVELAEPKKKGSRVGGNGFGVVTCLEDYCWMDIRLSGNPMKVGGGKEDGFGTLWEYRHHCDTAEHKRGRDERCKKTGKRYQPSDTRDLTSTNSPLISSRAAPPSTSASAPSAHSMAGPSSSSSANQVYSLLDDVDDFELIPPSLATRSVFSSSRPINQLGVPEHRAILRTPSGPNPLQESQRHNIPSSSQSSYRSEIKDIKPSFGTGLIRSGSSGKYSKPSSQQNPLVISDDEDQPSSSAISAKSRPETGSSSSRQASASNKPLHLTGNAKATERNDLAQMMIDRLGVTYQSRIKPEPAVTNTVAVFQPSTALAPSAIWPSQPYPFGGVTVKPESGLNNNIPPTASSAIGANSSSGLIGQAQGQSKIPFSAQHAAMKEDIRRAIRKEMGLIRDLILASRTQPGQPSAPHINPTQNGLFANRVTQLGTLLRSNSLSRSTLPPLNLELKVSFPSLASSDRSIRAKLHNYQMARGVLTAPGVSQNPQQAGPSIPIGAVGPAIPFMPGEYPGVADHYMDDLDDVNAYPWRQYEADRPTDLTAFFKDSLKDFDEDQTVDDALKKLGLPSSAHCFAEMTVTLMPHQILGVAFMLEKEKDVKFQGGLLCDAMGLGKTVQTIATIAGNPSSDKKVKTTLIVAPLAVLQQWKIEIESKTAAGSHKVLIHHGSTKAKSAAGLRNADVVLTTYGTLTAEFNEKPKQKRKKKKVIVAAEGSESQAEEEGESDDEPEPIVRTKGVMFKVRWYRVVLDEAHQIRNKSTRASKAAWELDSVLRWSLTGTLVNNSLADVFPHLRFLGISPSADETVFNKTILKFEKKMPRLATKRLQAILKTCMVRRHKESMLNGQRLLQLPPKTSEVITMEFSPEEREIYERIENRMKIKFGSFLKQGTVLKHMSCVLVMLMRLRQLTCHPWLLRRNPGDPAHPSDFTVSDEDVFNALNIPIIDAAKDFDKAIQLMGSDWIEDMARRLQERYERLTNMAKRDEDVERDNECSICLDLFQDETITSCKHSFCKTCIDEIFTNPPRDDLSDEEMQKGMRKCPMCRSGIEKVKTFAAVAFFDPEKDKDEKPVVNEASPDRKGKRKSVEAAEEDSKPAKDEKETFKKLFKGKGKAKEEQDMTISGLEKVVPSAKMKYLLNLVQEYLAQPDIKIIIFSEFVSFLELCHMLLEMEKIPNLMYYGGLRPCERTEVIKEFTAPISNERSPRIMLISRKAGGAGLNLTVASKVISLDLAWNAAAENQAVDRAHRIGQTRPVDVKRLVIANTVEQRILDLQERKAALADGAMGEGGDGRLGRLTVGDLARLFNYDVDDN